MLRRILLSPFALLWGLVLRLRHALYDAGILKSHRPAVSTIVVGNLSFGGTGKTPHVELVLDALVGVEPIATLSRGYGRSGKEIREVNGVALRQAQGDMNVEDTADTVGDEPLMLKRAHQKVRVFVGADRVAAVEEIQRSVPDVKAVILDDAFQHRRLNAGLNILLTTWAKPYCDDALVPAGTLRDLKSRAKAAQVVVVTKCPMDPRDAGSKPGMTGKEWRERLGLRPEQRLFFSGLEHGTPQAINGPANVPTGPSATALLVTGVADPEPLLAHVRSVWGRVQHMAFPDHHAFSRADVDRLAQAFATFAGPEKTLVTTAKDAVRLLPLIKGSALEKVPIAVVPVKARILNDPDGFHALLRQHLRADPAHR